MTDNPLHKVTLDLKDEINDLECESEQSCCGFTGDWELFGCIPWIDRLWLGSCD